MSKSLEKIKRILEMKTGAISVTKDRDTMEHDPNDQVTVGTYKTKHFEISPEAQKLFLQGIPPNTNAIDAEHLAIHHDKLFSLVKGAMVKKQVSDVDMQNAKDHLSKIQYLSNKLGLAGKVNYLDPHLEKLAKHSGAEGNPFTSKPTDLSQEPRDFDVDNTKQFITRAAKAERKVKVIDDSFKPEESVMETKKGTVPKTPKEKKLAAHYGYPDVITHGDVVTARKKSGNQSESANEQQAADWQIIQKMDKGSLVGGKKGVKTRLAYLKAVHAHQKKHGLDASATRKKIEGVNRTLVQLGEAAVTNNPGHGYHGQHSDDADQKYSKMHARVRTLTGTNSTMAKHYLDSTHGRHLAGNEGDSEYIKRDFLKFAKKYNADQFKEEVEQVDELKKSTLASYVKKAAFHGALNSAHHAYAASAGDIKNQEYHGRKSIKRQKGIATAADKLAREEVEQVDEMQQGKEYTQKQLQDKIKSGNWEASYDIKPGKNVEMRHRSGKKVTVMVKNVQEEAEQVDERSHFNKQLKNRVMRQIGSHAFIEKGTDEGSPLKTGRKVAKTTPSKKVAQMYRKLPNPVKTTEELEQIEEGRRGRPPKDPEARAKFYAATTTDEPDQHIMMRVKAAADSEKPVHITFKDGAKHPVEPAHAKKVLKKYMGMKPLQKRDFQKKIETSHSHFMSEV